MIVCMVTNMYPTDDRPSFGAFVKSQIDSIEAAGHDVSLLRIDGRSSSWDYIAAVSRLKRILDRRHHDVVHAHYGLSGVVACMQRRRPVVVSFCGDDLQGTSNGRGGTTLASRGVVGLSRYAALRAAAVIVKTRRMKSFLKNPTARDKAVVIPNGVDFDLFRPVEKTAACAELGLDPNARYVLFPSAPDIPGKRYDLAEAAFELLKSEFDDARLIVLEKRPQREVPLVMGACDAMVFTSDREGSANVIKEAMACDLPIVSVDAGDAWEMIEDATHCHRAARDPHDLAAKLSLVLSAAGRSDGRIRISHLELGAVAQRVVHVYESVLD